MPLYLPNTGQATDLPIQIVDPNSLTLSDEELLVAMSEHPPATKFKAGDLAYLHEAPPYLRNTRKLLPRMWQVRFIISQWQHELMTLVQTQAVHGIDHAITLLDQQGFPEAKFRKPVLYCHAFPHGMYPDSAAWLPERVLRRVTFRESNQAWMTILDEAKAPFVGYDTTGMLAPYTYDLAPDLYSKGENLGRPFSFEEATVHTAALLGMEEVLCRPVDPYYINNYRVDPAHDIFKK
jgi:hypothetical protein